MRNDDIFDFGSDAIAEVVLQQNSERFCEQYERELASAATLAWVQNGDSSPEIFAEIVEMATGFANTDDEDEDYDEDDEEYLEEVQEAVTDFLESHGVSPELTEQAFDGNADASRKIFLLMEKSLDGAAQSIEEMHYNYTFEQPIRESNGMSKGEWRKSNRVKTRKRQGKIRKKRLTARQRMAVKKMLRKSHRGIANLNRKKTVRKRKAAGFY